MHGANETGYTHLVGEDNFYLEYSVKVGAFNKHGSGPNSTVQPVMSAEGSKLILTFRHIFSIILLANTIICTVKYVLHTTSE